MDLLGLDKEQYNTMSNPELTIEVNEARRKASLFDKVAASYPKYTWDANSMYPIADGEAFVVFSKGFHTKMACLVDAGGTQLFAEVS